MSDGLYDPQRVVTAGRIGQLIHAVHKVGRWQRMETLCGETIDHGDLLIVQQMPERITCKECRAFLPGLPLL